MSTYLLLPWNFERSKRSEILSLWKIQLLHFVQQKLFWRHLVSSRTKIIINECCTKLRERLFNGKNETSTSYIKPTDKTLSRNSVNNSALWIIVSWPEPRKIWFNIKLISTVLRYNLQTTIHKTNQCTFVDQPFAWNLLPIRWDNRCLVSLCYKS